MNKINKPIVSIIIPHYNNYQILESCINSLFEIRYNDFEIILVDDCSSDNSIEKIKKKYDNLIIQKTPKNLGFTGACNLGAKIAKGLYLLFLNNDTIHDKHFLEPLIKKIESNDSIASVQPKIKNINNISYFDYAGGSGGFIDYLVFPFARGRVFDTIEKDVGQYNNSKKIFWTSGTCFLTRKKIFQKIGGFDEKLFAHMEEIDYCWKSYLAGYENWVEPLSIIYHHGGKTLPYSSYKKTYLNHRNSMILLLTNYSFGLSCYLFLIRLFLELISSIRHFLKLELKDFFAHYVAILYLFYNIKYLYKRRILTNKIRIKSDQEILEQNIILNESLVKKYFIFRKSKFIDIFK